MTIRITEQKEQINFVHWFRLQYPELQLLLVHFANGGYRDPRSASLFKAMGVIAGYPDLGFFYPSGQYHGLFIEMKRPLIKGKARPVISIEQKIIMEALDNQGYYTQVAYGFEQAKLIMNDYLDLPDFIDFDM